MQPWIIYSSVHSAASSNLPDLSLPTEVFHSLILSSFILQNDVTLVRIQGCLIAFLIILLGEAAHI